jgi:hypothetical protein
VPLAGIAVAIAIAVIHAWPSGHRARPAPVIGAGAYLSGGSPQTDLAIEEMLITDLTQLVVQSEIDRNKRGVDWERERLLVQLRAPQLIVGRGDRLATAWRAMIDCLEHWIYMPASGVAVREYGKQLRARRFARSAISSRRSTSAIFSRATCTVRTRSCSRIASRT